jgi:hypothetical protein
VNAILPQRIPKKRNRSLRWRSPAHLAFVRSHACCHCGSTVNIEAAHVRLGSGAGMGQKPDDWRAVSLCGFQSSEDKGCHYRQHLLGEATFWGRRDVGALIEAFIKASPRRLEIERARREREAAD